jgi:hypothetical protein
MMRDGLMVFQAEILIVCYRILIDEGEPPVM